MKATTVVIGGTGFIGSALVERLAESGHRVALISRSGRWRWGARPVGVVGIACDISDAGSSPILYEAFRGARLVVNLAGALWRRNLPRSGYKRLHVDGARLVLDALHAAAGSEGPTRLVHVSTTGVLGPTGPEPLDERALPAPSNEYERTKLEGEKLALAARGAGLEVVVARPGLVYGARDMHLLEFFRAIDSGFFRPIGGGGATWQPVHNSDVISGLETMLKAPGVDGGVFHLAGAERVTVADLAFQIARALGRRAHVLSLPRPIALATGAMLEALAAPLRTSPPLSRARVRTLTEDRVYSIAAAAERLGWRPLTRLDEGLPATIGWYRAQGFLAR
ncbi:MAG TPA: NAD-dependent epimerase/dehydratase family protein [Candidatus Polarisedimenticolaceae bacterium]|nr:NAD-dependent epimerase/dehydratase family protein [Candidatus Polarisedimenticolaceae bacterium]